DPDVRSYFLRCALFYIEADQYLTAPLRDPLHQRVHLAFVFDELCALLNSPLVQISAQRLVHRASMFLAPTDSQVANRGGDIPIERANRLASYGRDTHQVDEEFLQNVFST